MVTITRTVHHGNYYNVASATGHNIPEALDRLPVTAYDSREPEQISEALETGQLSFGGTDYRLSA